MSAVFFDAHGFQLYSFSLPDVDEQALWTWGLASSLWKGWLVEGIRTGLAYRLDHARGERWLALLRPERLEDTRVTDTTVRLVWAPNRHGLAFGLEFRVWPKEAPGLLAWRLYVHHRGTQPIRLERWVLAEVGPWKPDSPGILGRIVGLPKRFTQRTAAPEPPPPGAVRLHDSPAPLGFYAHSWSSWGEVRTYWETQRERQRIRWIDRLTPSRYVPGAPLTGRTNQFWADFFGILLDTQHQRGLLAGFLSQIRYFGGVQAFLHHLHPALRILALGDGARLEPGGDARSDWAVLFMFDLSKPHGLDPYLRLAAAIAGRQIPEGPPSSPSVGWNSWFAFYRSLDQGTLNQNLDQAVRWRQQGLPLEIFHIDEGYSEEPARWDVDRRRFPKGLRDVAHHIRARGFIPGIWQAPLLWVGWLPRRYRDMALRCRGWERPCFAFWGWNTWVWGLDPTHPRVIKRAVQWALDAAQKGFRFLKLDFLSAGALDGKRHRSDLSRAQSMRSFLRHVVRRFRDESGPAAHVAMGSVPLGSALGLADMVRVGPDVAPTWEPHPPYRWLRRLVRDHPDAPSVRNALRNGMMRSFFHGIWWENDPDAIPDALPETLWRTWLTWVSLAGGAWFLSADLKSLSPQRLRWLMRFSPPLGQRPWVVDLWERYPPRRVRLDLDGPIGRW
ncbi:MAG: hypothetical protein GXO36_06135, partial [Chloroflexi bacterium]|nr:hypothetical protein [Chloroflexota bacterium]